MNVPHPGGALALSKLHGLGNDFLVVLDQASPGEGPDDGTDRAGPGWAGAARRLCDRHRGIGADGLILGGRGPAGALTFRIWNADGSEAEMSGNGIRCLAHAALDAGWVTGGQPFAVLTPAGSRSVTIRRTPADPPEPGPSGRSAASATWATVEMGPAKVSGPPERCNVGHGQLLVDVGNPHLVVLGPDPAGVDVAGLGAALEAGEPGGLNVEFVTLGPGRDEITMRVWERGVGETAACGTGSVAAAAAAHHWGRVGPAVTVHQPGGALVVGLHPDGTADLSGPSEHVAHCSVPW